MVRSIREIYGGVVNSGEPLIFDALIEDVKKLIGKRHFVARSPVLSAPKGPNISAHGTVLKKRTLALKGRNKW